VDFDLLGDPIPPGHEGPGRPAHEATDAKRQKCVLLAAMGRKRPEIAQALGIDQKTLRKHYSRELRILDAARLRVEGELLMALARKSGDGDTGATKELFKRLDRAELRELAPAAKKPKPTPLGKKEQRKADARRAVAAGSWGDLVDGKHLN
jgi:hypothetical protein